MRSIAYGNGKFVAVMSIAMPEGWTWSASSPRTQKMLYSTDGINWTVKDTALRDVIGLTFSNGRFFASGGELSSYLWTSTDGENWIEVVNTQGAISGPVYGNGKWVFVTRYYSNRGVGGNIMYSTDGVTWTNVANRPSRFDFHAIAYGDGKFIAMDEDGRMAYSADGVTWTVPSGTHGNGVRAIAYGAGKFVKIGWDHSSYSDDGLTWTFIDWFGFSNSVATNIVYGGGKFVATDYNGRMATSVDGVTWTVEEFDVFGGTRIFQINGIAYGAGRFFAVEDTDDGTGKSPTGAGRIAYSNLFDDATPSPPPIPATPTPQAQSASRFMLVNAATLNVRSGPSADHAAVGQVTQNTRVQVLDSSGAWWRIRAGAVSQRRWRWQGYVNSAYLVAE